MCRTNLYDEGVDRTQAEKTPLLPCKTHVFTLGGSVESDTVGVSTMCVLVDMKVIHLLCYNVNLIKLTD